MSLLNKANIITTPTAYSVGKLHSVKPENEIYADFDFARNSSATRVGENGLIQSVAANLPRINYENGIGHLLLEPQRTNLVTYSESFSNAYWIKSNSSITSNAAISPDGTLNADKLVESATNSYHAIWTSSLNVVANTDFTFSAYVKKADRKYVTVGLAHSSAEGAVAQFNLDTQSLVYSGDIGSIYTYVSSGIEAIGNNWYKLHIVFQTTLTVTNPAIALSDDIFTSSSITNTANNYTGDGTSGVYIFGAQVEVGSYPTSYIVSNSGSATTRLAEVCNGSGNASTFNDSEGVLMAQVSTISTNENSCISINDSSLVNRVELLWFSDGKLYTQVGNSGQTAIDSNTLMNKISVRWNSGTYYLWVNGFSIFSDTYTSLSGLNSLDFLRQGSYTFKGKTKQIAYFPEALTDSELECLTSWSSFNRMAIDLNYTIQ